MIGTLKRTVTGLMLALSLACAGADGIMGPAGSAGRDGVDGKNGTDGKDGAAAVFDKDAVVADIMPLVIAQMPAGIKGDKGDTGSTGAAGAQGPQGEKGDSGATGATGPPGGGGVLGNVVTGDLLVTGRICVADVNAQCVDDAEEQIQIASLGSSSILMRSNMSGLQFQNPATHWGSFGLSSDGGIRLLQNIRWTKNGTMLNFIDPTRETAIIGTDSRGEWSWNGQKVGRGSLGTQRLVLRTDEDNKLVYFALWAEGYKLGVKTSTEGCKWCENQSYIFPTQ